MPVWFVSYAWRDDTSPAGLMREQQVDQACEAARELGVAIRRDKDVLRPGDSIERFMRDIGAGDRIFVFLSDKYLRSPFCMFELCEVWRQSRQNAEVLRGWLRLWTLGDADVWTPEGRASYARYWRERHDRLKADVADLGERDLLAWQRMRTFHNEVGDILATLADTVQPRDFEEFLRWGFSEVPPGRGEAATQFLMNQSEENTAHTINDSFNQNYNPYDRPPLDITPSSVTKMFPLRGILKVSVGVLSFVFVILLILWENIFHIKDYLTGSLIWFAWWALGIDFLLPAIFGIVSVLILKITGGIRLLSGAWVVVDKDIVHIQFRRACPFSECGGVMEPKNIKDVGPRWVCRRNCRLHVIKYDHTQIASAMKSGQLNSKIETVKRESYRESRRRARQVQRADFP